MNAVKIEDWPDYVASLPPREERYPMKQNARKDANQDEIVNGLRGIGASVAITHMLGKGFPDIVVGFRGQNYLLEIKDGNKPPSRRQLTTDETTFHEAWGGQIAIVESVEDAYRVIGATD